MAPSKYSIERETHAGGGRYVVRLAGGAEAEMTYRRVDAGTIAFDHTYVPRAHRGQGIAESLVDAGIADARAEGQKIVPLCSYVAAQFQRHPEWANLRAP